MVAMNTAHLKQKLFPMNGYSALQSLSIKHFVFDKEGL